MQIGSESLADIATDERIKRFADNSDPGLAALYYQFGRYLLIASSRPGTEAANLQGIWNDMANPWWDSKYTVNINLPMNYWPAETANLSELTNPLTRLTKEVSEAGASVAKEHWGARGWVLHQNTDIWRATAPMDGPSWGAWPVGGAWLTTHLWEHYLFTEDEDYLREVYPIMRGAVMFLSDIRSFFRRGDWILSKSPNYGDWANHGYGDHPGSISKFQPCSDAPRNGCRSG
jgi:alpha-L-fucosidase 2